MHLTISVAVSLRDFYCSLSHGAASVWVFGFGATDSLCPFAISLARHLLSLSRSRFPHWGHVISSGVWMWQENDSVLGSQFSVLSLFMHFQRAQRSNSRHPLVCPHFSFDFFFCSLSCCFCLCWLLLSAQPRTSFALDDAKDYQVVGMWQRPKEEYKLSSMLVGHYAGPNRIRTSAYPLIRLSAYPKYPLPCPFFFFLVPANRQQQVQRADSFRPSFYVYPYSYYLYFIQTALGFGIHFCGWDLSTPKRFIYCGFLNSARMSKMSED